ncbi:Predicted kinase, aminoglycoside phosphotransferase (APT) family [Microbacterium sp. cf046]|nr:Predicted kinase, aminoglycoside phosphotransferase (APT) family [Microbacterium sp. cf046]
MHDDQLHIDLGIARRLIVEQLPECRDLPVTALAGSGTVNAIFRIGDDLTARFPLQGLDAAEVESHLEREAAALGEFRRVCPFPAPRPLMICSGGHGYPLPWSVQTWVPGEIASPRGLSGSLEFAEDLVRLIQAMRDADVAGRVFSGEGRGGVLRDGDEWVAECLRRSTGLVDVDRIGALWARLRELPYADTLVMSHRDLIPANLLVGDGRLVGVLDGGGYCPADPALDLVAGWHLLDDGPRAALRDRLGSGRVEWFRGAGWALQQAMGLIWYYADTNPTMAELGRSTVARLMADEELGALVSAD